LRDNAPVRAATTAPRERGRARTRLQAARGTFDRILGKPPQAFTGDAENPLSIVIEEVALRVAGNGDGASA